MPRAYNNPTEDAAIGNIMREERMKKRRAAENAVHANCNQPATKKRNRERQRANRRLKNREEG